MQRRITLSFCLLLAPHVVAAQTVPVCLQPYTFAAPGSVSGAATLHVGGGVDAVHRSGLGAGIELGYTGLVPDGFDYGVGLLSLSGSYRWASVGRLRPFVAGGYTTTVIRGAGAQLFHAGAGLEYWWKRDVGIRVEVRDHTQGYDGHLWGCAHGHRVGTMMT